MNIEQDESTINDNTTTNTNIDEDEDLEDLKNLQNAIDDDDDDFNINNDTTSLATSISTSINNSDSILATTSRNKSTYVYHDEDEDDDIEEDDAQLEIDDSQLVEEEEDDDNTDFSQQNKKIKLVHNNNIDNYQNSNNSNLFNDFTNEILIDTNVLPTQPSLLPTLQTTPSLNTNNDFNIDVNYALTLNLEYQRIIKKYIENIEAAMEKNTELLTKAKSLSSLPPLKSSRGMGDKKSASYFTLENGESPPDNPDTAFLKQNFDSMPMYFKARKWTKNDCQQLASGIREKNLQLKLFEISERNLSKQQYQREMSNISNITPKELEMNLDGINWESLSHVHLPGRTPLECELRWKNHDHPAINKEPFTKEEDKKLLALAKKYQGHQWFEICRELGSARSPVQCCQRYQRSLNTSFMKREWTKEEDEILRREYYKCANMGDKSWQLIAEALEGRTGQQCLHRWQKTLDPSIKRGRWTAEEDDLLSKAVELYGKGNWILIKNHVPGRTDMQCRERWCNVVDPILVKNPWSPEEDATLRALVEKHGIGKWSLISKEIQTRTDNQCWRRWKQLYSKTTFLEEYKEILSKKKEMIVSNFVGREKERPAFTINDFLSEDKLKEIQNLASQIPDPPIRVPKVRGGRGGSVRGRGRGKKSLITPRSTTDAATSDEFPENSMIEDGSPTTTTTTTTTTTSTTSFTPPTPTPPRSKGGRKKKADMKRSYEIMNEINADQMNDDELEVNNTVNTTPLPGQTIPSEVTHILPQLGLLEQPLGLLSQQQNHIETSNSLNIVSERNCE